MDAYGDGDRNVVPKSRSGKWMHGMYGCMYSSKILDVVVDGSWLMVPRPK